MARLGVAFVCDQCGINCRLKHDMSSHIGSMHGHCDSFICDLCSKQFSSSKANLRRHIRVTHEQSRRFKCQLCVADYNSKANLTHHHSVIHLGIKVECDDCGKLLDKENLVAHISSLRHKQPFKCDQRPVYSKLNSYQDKRDAIFIKCDPCGKLFRQKNVLAEHIIAIHQRLQFECAICGKHYGHRSQLIIHKSLKHGGTKGPTYECDTCGKVYEGRRDEFTLHMKLYHQQRRVFKCAQCGARYRNFSNLRDHTAIKHSGKQVVMQCEHCDAVFGQKNYLTNHIRSVHLNLRPFKCDQCPAAFRRVSGLAVHNRGVHRNIVYLCDLCSKRSKGKRYLASHYFATHMELNIFQCSVCGQMLPYPMDLTRHRKTHR